MTSLTLKEGIEMYGFEDANELYNSSQGDKLSFNNKQAHYVGSKEGLLTYSEEFWKPLVEWLGCTIISDEYKDYRDSSWFTNTAKESGHSAIEALKENNYILIVETNA